VKNNTTIGILSLGCPRNLVDSENVLGRLNLKGFPIVDMAQADVAIVNTCAFIEDARTESVDAILDLIDLKKQSKLKKIIVYGCLAERYKDKLKKELPEVDAFVGKISFPANLFKKQAGSRLISDDWRENHDLDRFPLTPRHYVYLKICEGCINNCSYCCIPKIKGRFASLDTNSILKKIEEFDKNRVAEVNIVGQDITGYGMDLYRAARLPGLLNKIVKKTGNIGWIRLLYLYPSRVTDELLDLIKDSPKICKYVDLPIQHINDRILKLMHRDTTNKDTLKLIDKIRKKIPGVAIRTSLIVGFPTETDKEFRELLKFIEGVRFERLGAFIYSKEEGTPAYNFKKQVPGRIKIERLNAVMSLQQKISQDINKKFLGSILDVLIEEKEDNSYLGRSQYDAPEVDGVVYVNSQKELNPGDFVKVRITDTLEYDLVGEEGSAG
jgi:ribosomal protein S12 methylthiotransferase